MDAPDHERLQELRKEEAEIERRLPQALLHIQVRLRAQLQAIRDEIRKLRRPKTGT